MLGNLDRWDVAILAVATYVAVSVLVRMMRDRHQQLIAQFRREVEAEHRRAARSAPAKPKSREAA